MSNTRKDRGFRFPLQKYSDEKALYTNFKYLQEYLNYIRRKDKFAATVDIALAGTDAEARAQHIADGTNDHVQIQAAIDALPSTGGHVYVHEGTYSISATISLPAKRVIFSGPGIFDFQGTTTNFGVGFGGTSGGVYFFEGLTFTGDVRDDGQSDRGSFVFSGGSFYASVGCQYKQLSFKTLWNTVNFAVVGNTFSDIELRRGKQASDVATIAGDPETTTTDVVGTFTGNMLDGLTTAAPDGNASFYLVGSEGGTPGIIVTGNTFEDVSGLSSNFHNVKDSHNVVDGTMVDGTHSSVDHGDIAGLSDDDHTQYVLRNILTTQGDIFTRDASAIKRLALGTSGDFLKAGASEPAWATLVEADISDLDHTDADAIHDDIAGEIAALTQVTAAGGDHILIEDADDSNNKKRVSVTSVQSAETDHGSLSGLGDDDHTQYLNDTRHDNIHTGAAVNLSSGFTVAHNTETAIEWDNEVFDDDDYWEGVTNPERLTVPATGLYIVTLSCPYGPAEDTGRRDCKIRVNGTTNVAVARTANNNTNTAIGPTASTVVSLTSGDYVEALALQTSGGDLNVGAGNAPARFSIARIR